MFHRWDSLRGDMEDAEERASPSPAVEAGQEVGPLVSVLVANGICIRGSGHQLRDWGTSMVSVMVTSTASWLLDPSDRSVNLSQL